MRPTRAARNRTLMQLDADRAGLVKYASHFTTDLAEAERVVDEALVEVVARGGSASASAGAGAVRWEVCRTFRKARRQSVGQSAAAAPEAALATVLDPAQRVSALAARVRRRRARRTAMVAAGAIGVLGLGSAAVYGVGRLAGEVPAPMPTVTPTTTPTTTPTPTAEPPAILEPVTVGSTLPEALPLGAGMLEAAGPGWSLVQYENGEVAGGLIYLVSPAGDLYEVPTPLAGPDATGGTLTDWLPGSTLVTVDLWSQAGMWWSVSETDVVDLLTGERLLTVHHTLAGVPYELTYATVAFIGDGSTDLLVSFEEYAGEGPSTGLLTVRLALDGRELARMEDYRGAEVGGSWSALSPDGSMLAQHQDGRLLVLATSDFAEVSTLTSPYPDRPEECGVSRWAGPDGVFLRCWHGAISAQTGARLYYETWVAPLDGGQPTLIDSMDPSPRDPWQVGDLALIRAWGDSDTQVLRPDGTAERLISGVPSTITASARGLLYAFDEEYEGYWADQALVTVDPVTGSIVELFGAHSEYDRIAAVLTHGDR